MFEEIGPDEVMAALRTQIVPQHRAKDGAVVTLCAIVPEDTPWLERIQGLKYYAFGMRYLEDQWYGHHYRANDIPAPNGTYSFHCPVVGIDRWVIEGERFVFLLEKDFQYILGQRELAPFQFVNVFYYGYEPNPRPMQQLATQDASWRVVPPHRTGLTFSGALAQLQHVVRGLLPGS